MSMTNPSGHSGDQQVLTASFEADVHLIQILGEQLIGSEKVGVLELIKNTYDAGATRCDVWIEKVPGLLPATTSDPQVDSLPGPVITIVDNGSGMNERDLRDGWLRPATRIKTSLKERLKRERAEAEKRGNLDEYERLVSTLKMQHGGRLPLGEKGVGRFATHRLGSFLTLQTKVKDEPFEWVIEIDWNDFVPVDDKPQNLQDVPVRLVRRVPQRDYGPTDSGTLLRIYGGREGFAWTQSTLREIGEAISLLRSPVKAKTPQSFEVEFHCPQLLGAVFQTPTESVPAPIECTAIVYEDGRAEIEIRLKPPLSLSKPFPAEVWAESTDLRQFPPDDDINYWHMPGSKSLRKPECGPFSLEIKFWYRVKEWIEAADWKGFRDYLTAFGGIGVYRDGLSILPPQVTSRDDWLRLSKRHIQKGSNISYYQLWGVVDLAQQDTLSLIERTSREGLLETRPFQDLSELVRTVILGFLEFRVQEVREQYDRLNVGERITEQEITSQTKVLTDVLGALTERYDFRADPLMLHELVGEGDVRKNIALAAALPQKLKAETKVLSEQSDALLEAAGYGIAIAVAVHEIEKTASTLYFGLERLSKRLASIDPELLRQTHDLMSATQALANELKRLAPLRVTRLERQRTFRIRESILTASGAFQRAWSESGISFSGPPIDNDFEVTGAFAACTQVFANLFDNATYWLRAGAGVRRITVQADPSKKQVILADSGPGIDEKMRPHLFDLFYSLKNPPSGLGLYICRYYLRQLRGSIRETYEKDRLPGFPGAQFTLQFPNPPAEEQG